MNDISKKISTLLDRFYGPVSSGSMHGKILYFLYQGAAPEKWMMDAGKYTMKRFEGLYGFTWGSMVTTAKQAASLKK